MSESSADGSRTQAEDARANIDFNDAWAGVCMDINDATNAGQNHTKSILGINSKKHAAQIVETLGKSEHGYQVTSEDKGPRTVLSISWPKEESGEAPE